MAAIDAFATFSGGFNAAGAVTYQTATGTDTSVVSTNSYDTTGASPSGQNIDLGKGGKLDLVTQIGTTVTGGTSAEIQMISADDAALTTNVTVLGSSGAIPVASLPAGKQVVTVVPVADPRTVRRYIGVRYVFVGAVAAGSYFASLQRPHGDVPQPAYKSGFTIL